MQPLMLSMEPPYRLPLVLLTTQPPLAAVEGPVQRHSLSGVGLGRGRQSLQASMYSTHGGSEKPEFGYRINYNESFSRKRRGAARRGGATARAGYMGGGVRVWLQTVY